MQKLRDYLCHYPTYPDSRTFVVQNPQMIKVFSVSKSDANFLGVQSWLQKQKDAVKLQLSYHQCGKLKLDQLDEKSLQFDSVVQAAQFASDVITNIFVDLLRLRILPDEDMANEDLSTESICEYSAVDRYRSRFLRLSEDPDEILGIIKGFRGKMSASYFASQLSEQKLGAWWTCNDQFIYASQRDKCIWSCPMSLGLKITPQSGKLKLTVAGKFSCVVLRMKDANDLVQVFDNEGEGAKSNLNWHDEHVKQFQSRLMIGPTTDYRESPRRTSTFSKSQELVERNKSISRKSSGTTPRS